MSYHRRKAVERKREKCCGRKVGRGGKRDLGDSSGRARGKLLKIDRTTGAKGVLSSQSNAGEIKTTTKEGGEGKR